MAPHTAFISYSSKDESLRQELDAHLALLKREGVIDTWTFRDIDAGSNWKSEIDQRLESADIILLLVTASFIASDYCWNVEMKRAIERHRDASAVVVPTILRACDWTSAPFAAIQALPTGGKPVANWRPREKAWANVVGGLRRVLERWSKGKSNVTSVIHPETPVQRAHRLAADSAARKSHDERIRSSGFGAAKHEATEFFALLDKDAREVRAAEPALSIESGSTEHICIVRLSPLALHAYSQLDSSEPEKSSLEIRLLFGGMVLPHESGIFYPEQPQEHTTLRYHFALSAAGQWGWRDKSGEFLTTNQVVEQALHSFLDFKDDVETGKVTRPRLGSRFPF